MTATYNYLGYGITDSNGKAKLEYDAQGNQLSHSYTGTGAGEVDIVASLDSSITDSSLVSETFVITDCVFRDGGVTGDSNYTQFYGYTNFNPQVSNEGTLLTNSVASTYNYYANIDSTSDLYDFTAPFCLEFDVVNFTGTVGTQIAESGQSGAIRTFSQLGITGACHLKITVDGSQISYQIDNGTPITQDYTTTTARVSIIINNGTLTYKNFMIYPI